MRLDWIMLCLIVFCGACVDAGEAGIVELDGSEPNKRAAIDLLPYFKFLSAELTRGDPIPGPDGVVSYVKLIGWDGEHWQWIMVGISRAPVMSSLLFHVDQLPSGLKKVTVIPVVPAAMIGPASQISATWIVKIAPSGEFQLIDRSYAEEGLVCQYPIASCLGARASRKQHEKIEKTRSPR